MIAGMADDVKSYLPEGTPFIDLGPGTLKTVAEKSLPFIRAVQSNIYIPIDTSIKFCSEAGTIVRKHVPRVKVVPCFENFFSREVRRQARRQIKRAKRAEDSLSLGFRQACLSH